ncbi:c-type cytochrome domain-containing protein [Spirosoma validum]|uniref:Chitobiase/beta-hexosaminidase C-terminal domain-containing protein n=1 Tax=Spirosoma validum TaxID=2771355 RepID=A0A927B450_9BACT|nr:c-type cytochrome domain-containing protein [Spirosoma validum]MBD2755038.1 chitobiase/beta-hexosaminidase C-terminal domain-containing protein [Spirosoma validum]
MQKKLAGLAEQALFASAVFILVLLLFESKIVIPVWLQPIGRLHPLILHFPIVILLLAVVMEVFRFNKANTINRSESRIPDISEFYRTFSTNLLLVGALLAAVTVIMGLFLSREDGYTGAVVQWHKWTGVLTFYLAALIYWSRRKTWYSPAIAQTGAVLMGIVLIGAGHYGSVITHGEDFILAPVTHQLKSAPVDLQQALVFNDVIKPIFEQKCTSCHNPEKLKGELALTDAEAIRKGGKSGKLYVAGDPDVSLLLKRIHLPVDEKKHMPPSGKAQLTEAEIRLLALWVKGRAEFTKKVVDLPATDSLRIMAVALFKPTKQAEPGFAFDAADEETVKKLNTDYRTIAPLAKESPALAVNLYNKATYSPEKLQELSPIKSQVVYLNLNKMPVKDADLKYIGQFENLEKLDVNFTDITGKELNQLASLNHLKSLALSGTAVKYADLRNQIGTFKKLKTVALWETRLTDEEIHQLQKANPRIQFIAGFDGEKSEPIRLNPPQLKNTAIFAQSTPIQLRHPIKGVEIRYTTDGTDPDSIHSPINNDKTIITGSTIIKAKAYKSGWFSSPVVTFNYYKSGYKPDSANLLMPLNPVHQAEGANTFFDHKLGTFNANSPAWANNWAGVRKNDLVLVSEFKKPVNVTSVDLRTMIEPETGIFPPAEIEIWGGDKRDNLKLIATAHPEMPIKKSDPVLKAIGCTFKPHTVSYLKIVAKPVPKLPEWHGNKGKQALLLVDEVFIN